MVATTADGFRPAAADVGVALEIDVPTGCVAQADADRLAQVVANLVENALKYAASYIEVVMHVDGPAVTIVVGDDGPGIPDDELPRVFEPLYQSARAVGRQVGTGPRAGHRARAGARHGRHGAGRVGPAVAARGWWCRSAERPRDYRVVDVVRRVVGVVLTDGSVVDGSTNPHSSSRAA